MQNHYLEYPYLSRRTTVFAQNGMVAASQPLAAQAGLEMLKKGGNAVDAAVAAAACLTVVEPQSNGIGGDAFALIWHKGRLSGLNSSGPAPQSISIEKVKAKGHREIPPLGFIPVTVPGAPASWVECSRRFGKLPFAELLQPAINYAEQGYPIPPIQGKYWDNAVTVYRRALVGNEFKPWFDTFAPGGKAPAIGTMWRSKDHAQTLNSIAETKGESFYRGQIAEKIDAFSAAYGGFIRGEDLAGYSPQWVEPIKVSYRDCEIWETPPNGQGLIALMALKILEGYTPPGIDDFETCHKQIEALKVAFADGKKHITQRDRMTVTVEDLLSETYLLKLRSLISHRAIQPEPGQPFKGGTVYLAAADGEGNMVSFIQSNYVAFGSGLVVPGTGIALQNRGHTFSLDPDHANCLEPGKQTFHTIIPGFLARNGKAMGPFGVTGAFMQPQGHLQVVMNTVDFNLNPQSALDAPRWCWLGGKTVAVEGHYPQVAIRELRRRGHEVIEGVDSSIFGLGQIIWRDPDSGVLSGGTDHRGDSAIAAW